MVRLSYWSMLLLVVLATRTMPQRAETVSIEEATKLAVQWYTDGEKAGPTGSPQRLELQTQAIELLEQVVGVDRSYGQASFLLGMMRQQSGDAQGAFDAFALSVAADPLNADAYNNMGHAITILKPGSADGFESEAYYRKALAVDPLHRQATVNLALTLTAREEHDAAVLLLKSLVERDPSDSEAHYNLAFNHERMGQVMPAVVHYQAATATREGFVDAWLNLAAMHHRHGSLADAAAHYQRTMEIVVPGELRATQRSLSPAFPLGNEAPGGAAEGSNRQTPAVDLTDEQVLSEADRYLRGTLVMVHNNLGVALQQQGLVANATRHHRRAAFLLSEDIAGRKQLRRRVLAQTNAQVGAEEQRIAELREALDTSGLLDTLVHTKAHLYKARKMVCHWEMWDSRFVELLNLVKEHQLLLPVSQSPAEDFEDAPKVEREAALLPFDTLGADVNMALRMTIATRYSERLRRVADDMPWPTPEEPSGSFPAERVTNRDAPYHPNAGAASGVIIRRGLGSMGSSGDERGSTETAAATEGSPPATESSGRPVIPLRVGYLSYDFNEHPTAHLVEGLFIHHKRLSDASREASAPESKRRIAPRFQALALSYGKHDNSSYRAAVEEHSHLFVDLVEKGHVEATETIRRTGTHIIIDLQGHTLGGRVEITARRAAPIQANYLIFPGTSGAFWNDYLICDKHVVPPDHAPRLYFSEKLVFLPYSYQVNYYERHLVKFEATRRKQEQKASSLSRDAVFAAETSSSISTNRNSTRGITVGEETIETARQQVGVAAKQREDHIKSSRRRTIADIVRAENGLFWPYQERTSIESLAASKRDGNAVRPSSIVVISARGASAVPLSSPAESPEPPPEPLDFVPHGESMQQRPFVFVNFNKNDKLEPLSFGLWMSILRRTTKERSLLWLLRPSEKFATSSIEDNLRAVAAASGVDPRRLIFADRAPKHEHLARHVAGDLFLDTFFYGAHSTATDALRGGLPVLTCPGDAFARRVGVSLLENMTPKAHDHGTDVGNASQGGGTGRNMQQMLLTHSFREFEDLAVRLAKGHAARQRAEQESRVGCSPLSKIQSHLERGLEDPDQGFRLFDTHGFTVSMERAYALMWEVYTADRRTPRAIQRPGVASDHLRDPAPGTPPLVLKRHLIVGR